MTALLEIIDSSLLDSWSESVEFVADPARTVAYARATNDPIEKHLTGSMAPPVFAVVPAMEVMANTTMSLLPEEMAAKILHGEHDFRFHRPISPGERLTVRAKPIGVSGKRSGVTVTTLIETRDVKERLVNEQYFVGFFRGASIHGDIGAQSPDHSLVEALRSRNPDVVVEQAFDEDQTYRYAGPAGDPMKLHLDELAAQALGLPGIIIHGLCTIAFNSHAVITTVCPEAPERLKRLAVRLSAPARPKQAITTRLWRDAGTDERDVWAFETENNEGTAIIKDGRVELLR